MEGVAWDGTSCATVIRCDGRAAPAMGRADRDRVAIAVIDGGAGGAYRAVSIGACIRRPPGYAGSGSKWPPRCSARNRSAAAVKLSRFAGFTSP